MNPDSLSKTYDPSASEKELYDFWESSGFFNAEIDENKKPFVITMPPPNVTGILHMGHAYGMTIMDVLTRFKRMQGYSALWLPGTDHAGLATQIRVEQHLRETSGLSRHDLGRDAFVEECWKWTRQNGGTILKQIRSLGASCDWRRLRFTFDETSSRAVREVFCRLYEKGLIYKGRRIISWCPHCQTALSDAEVDYEDRAGHLWHVRYPVEGTDEYITIATTRPETMMGDTGIAVHPEDERYKHLIGKNAILPLMNRPIPIFADEYVEKDFGTGCVKVTPCHDPNDFEMGQRHGLEFVLIMDESAKINKNGGKYCGLTREEARKAVVKDLEEQGYLVKTEDYRHNVGRCYRCKTTIEPLISDQWFVKMAPLAEPALEVVRNKEIKFVPDRFTKIYNNWMENVHDWCISRQVWWGHRIPAFYCKECGKMIVSREDLTTCPECGGSMYQEDDSLDTWFSSALWTFSTLGWPDKTPELEYFHPTDVMITGYDIIFFWVARMIFSSLEYLGEIPFHTVMLTGLIRDDQGRKMSKSVGNGVDPIEVIGQYGADALRFTLLTGVAPGGDSRYYDERVQASRNFANKIWNAARFVLMNLNISDSSLPEKLDLEDRWILSTLNDLIKDVTENMEKYELGIAAEKLNTFIWDNYCDWYIELCKPRLQAGGETGERAQRVLAYVLSRALELLHPYMPFVTEAVWQALPHEGPSIMLAQWPKYDEKLCFPEDEADFHKIIAVIKTIRNRRAEMNVPPSRKAGLLVLTDRPELIKKTESYLIKLAYLSHIDIIEDVPADADKMVNMVAAGMRLFLPMGDLVDREKELARLNAELKKAEDNIKRIEAKLSNESFVSKAPAEVVDVQRRKLAEAKANVESIKASINNL